ncbi:hypothetical protein LWM68_08715 [Niabella sp. W65]|nr:hypothetical protein [Niabella sp. W65]MCH7362844.1 hypothetical protein [Niabella sp. W65]ULT38797.1 hypothetical protein KRR40_27395 [Niabella sp. I65]
MKRNILSVIAGLATAIITFLIIETISASLHRVPANFDFRDSIAVKTFYQNQPISLWLLVLAGWIVGSFLCGFLIKWISNNDNKKLPIIAGCILMLSAIANFFSLPHPSWFIIVGLIVFIPSTLLGYKLCKLDTNGNR